MTVGTIIKLNPERCVACYACVIACLDAHCAVDEDGPMLRRAIRVETDQGEIHCASLGCMHCEDAKCMAACPTKAIYRDRETQLVQVDSGKCIGCHSCLVVCPFGAPVFTKGNKMVKCDGCIQRVKEGRLPLCVQTCPSKALTFELPHTCGKEPGPTP